MTPSEKEYLESKNSKVYSAQINSVFMTIATLTDRTPQDVESVYKRHYVEVTNKIYGETAENK